MNKSTKTRILFVINPMSGTGNNVDYDAVFRQYSKDYDFLYHIFYTTGKDDSQKIKEHIKSFGPDMVVAVGGDGTVNIVAGLLVNTEIILGIIPHGSANGLAFNLNIPTNFEAALKVNLEGNSKTIDALLMNDTHYCFHLSDLGLNARIVKRFEKEGSRGLIGYGKQLFKELFSPKSYFQFALKTDDMDKSSKAEMIVMTNAHSFGTGVKINPVSDFNDGFFEIVVIKPYPWWLIFTFIFAGFTGNLHKMRYVDVYKTRSAELEMKQPQDFQIDGEIKDKTKSVKIEVVKKCLKVVYNQ